MPLKEYKPGTAFSGVIGRTVDQSEPAWPEPLRAKEGAPNVLFIVLDDTGFGHLGCYGSPIATPNMDSLAEGGVRYSNMHTTALCSPTRTCILTGRNHHSNNMACITEGSTGYLGYNANIPFENGFLSEMLLQHGYNTYAVGKWHLTPVDQVSPAGPYDRWPLGRGFERYYGFLGGDTHQYYPELTYDNHAVEPEKTPEEGYHLTEDLVDKAISFIADTKQVAPNKPFFMYFATGAMHAPHHVPKEWADKYKGKFDQGYEVLREEILARQKALGVVPPDCELTAWNEDVPQWEDISDDMKPVLARQMEIYAGFLEHTDYHIGRLIDALEDLEVLEDTLVYYIIGDNGASAEGTLNGTFNELLSLTQHNRKHRRRTRHQEITRQRTATGVFGAVGGILARPDQGTGPRRGAAVPQPAQKLAPGGTTSPHPAQTGATVTPGSWYRISWITHRPSSFSRPKRTSTGPPSHEPW